MAGIIIGDKIKNTDRGAINLDADYGPYASVETATTALTTAKKLKAGRTVGITQQDGSIKEYWVQPKGTTPETYGLVEKRGEDLTKALTLSGEQKHNVSANINDRAADVAPVTNEVKALGYKVLNPSASFASQVIVANTVYEIKDEFNLNTVITDIVKECTVSTDISSTSTPNVYYIDNTPIVISSGKGIKLPSDCVLLNNSKTGISFQLVDNLFVIPGTYYAASKISGNYTIELYENIVNIPVNCSLKFNGGKLKNGVIIGNNSRILAGDEIIFDGVEIYGTWGCKCNIAWYASGCDVNIVGGVETIVKKDESSQIQLALDSSFKELVFPPKLYYVASTLWAREEKRIKMDGGRLGAYLFQGVKSRNNACVIFTDQDITLLKIGGYRARYIQNFEIEGGNFDVSLCGLGGYSSNCIEVCTDNGTSIWGMKIKTSVYGTYETAAVHPGGCGIAFNVYTTSSNAYISMVEIDSFVSNFAVGIDLSNYVIATNPWMSDIIVKGQISGCINAVKTNCNSSIQASIQPARLFGSNNGESLIIVDGGSTVSISSMIWDVYNSEGGNYTNQYALCVKHPDDKVIASGLFADIFLRGSYGNGFGRRIDGYSQNVNSIYDRNFVLSNRNTKSDFIGSELHDSLLGFDLLPNCTYSWKLWRYDDEQETYSEDTNITVSGGTNIFRSDGTTTDIGLTTALSEKDKIVLTLDWATNSYMYIIYLYSSILSSHSNPIKCTCSWYDGTSLKVERNRTLKAYSRAVVDDCVSFVEAEIIFATKVEITFMSEGLTALSLRRIIGCEIKPSTGPTRLPQYVATPYLSRIGGRLFSDIQDVDGKTILSPNCAGSQRPTNPKAGFSFFDTNIERLIVYTGTKWTDVDGGLAIRKRGTSKQRPTTLTTENIGVEYYDTELLETIVWNGTRWTHSDTTDVIDGTRVNSTDARPSGDNVWKGYQLLDKGLETDGVLIIYNGAKWVLANAIVFELTGLKVNVAFTFYNNDFLGWLAPLTGYSLPENITVKSGTDTLVQGTDYLYDINGTYPGRIYIQAAHSAYLADILTITAVGVSNS